MANAKQNTEVKEAAVEEQMTAAPEMAKAATKEEMVTVNIPRIRPDEPDVFVSINDRTWSIQRGKYVEVPKCVAEVLEHQYQMLEQGYQFQQSFTGE